MSWKKIVRGVSLWLIVAYVLPSQSAWAGTAKTAITRVKITDCQTFIECIFIRSVPLCLKIESTTNRNLHTEPQLKRVLDDLIGGREATQHPDDQQEG